MEHYAIIVNDFYPFRIIAKSPILTGAAFLDPALHNNKFAL